jgi:DNA ligase-1
MPNTFKPMLAETVNIEDLTFPCICQQKLDGIRCIIFNNDGGNTHSPIALTRKLKKIPNKHIRETLSQYNMKYYDGEILTYTNGVLDSLDIIQSKVMTEDGLPDFKYYVFYHFQFPSSSYQERMSYTKPNEHSIILDYKLFNNISEVREFEQNIVNNGGEGIIVRHPNAKYKFGRSTEKEASLLKIKRFYDSEAIIIGFKEKLKNNNTKELDELGYTKRSSKKDGLVPANTLGSLIVRWNGIEFDIGSGFDDALRLEIWNNKEKYLGKFAKFKYQRIGPKGRSLLPIFLCIRNPLDM